MTSSISEIEIDELKRCYRAALKSNGEHMVTIQKLEKDVADRYLQESLLKDAADGLYRQSFELSKYFRQQHPDMKTDDVAQIFSQKLMDFQLEYVNFCKGKVCPGQGSDTNEAEKIKSLEEEIHSLKSEIVQMNMQENHELVELKQLNEGLQGEVHSMNIRMKIMADKLKSSKADNTCNELEPLTHQVNLLLEDIEWFSNCQQNDCITMTELEEKLKEANHHIVSKDDEIATMKLKIYKLQKGLYGAPARSLVHPRPLGERLVQAQVMDNHSPSPIPPQLFQSN